MTQYAITKKREIVLYNYRARKQKNNATITIGMKGETCKVHQIAIKPIIIFFLKKYN